MEARDWLLTFLALQNRPDEPPVAVDPLRIQKGMFLFAMESGPEDTESYSFIAYHYGPCSFEIYHDLESLVAEGLVRAEPVPGYSWARYVATPNGQAKAAKLGGGAASDLRDQLREIKQAVTGKGFLQLLRDVYSQYPDYAVNSIASGVTAR